MNTIDIDAFKFAVSKIEDGFVFEKFGLSFLNAVLGYDFIPVGGIKDRGIDGFEHAFSRNGFENNIYQLSIEQRGEEKLTKSIEKLIANKINFISICYVTNRVFKAKDIIIDKLNNKYKKNVRIYDLAWFAANANYSQATINAYHAFITSYLHEFNKPGKCFIVSDLENDPRLFVFLRQQFENRTSDNMGEILSDTLILCALEGTDPEKMLFKTSAEVKNEIRKFMKCDPKILNDSIDKRLKYLSTKPRKIKYFRNKGYCLPYSTRLEVQERNIKDASLEAKFHEQTEETVRKFISNVDVEVKDITALIKSIIHRIYHKQGLEFSDFILHGKSEYVIEKDLPDVISDVVDESSVIDRNKEKIKMPLLMAIRDIVYNGSDEQKAFLRCLSDTCVMMFMLHWDPKIATYFESMASQLKLFVDTSIIIPALSEYYLPEGNRRHWNLLKSAHSVGISLFVNEVIIDELTTHFQMIKNKYIHEFKNAEDVYTDEINVSFYVDEILIRAYFYSKIRKDVSSFDEFVDTFIDPSLRTAKEDMITFLSDQFGIKYVTKAHVGIAIDQEEESLLYEKLRGAKTAAVKAKNDSKTILTIYALREKNNEMATGDIFGYKTWWLSKDTQTYKAVKEVLGSKYPISCYMRPDFLYNYITLSPRRSEVDDAYKHFFPSLVGVNMSYHLPKNILESVRKNIDEHRAKTPGRIKAIMRNLVEDLKSNPSAVNNVFSHDALQKAFDIIKES